MRLFPAGSDVRRPVPFSEGDAETGDGVRSALGTATVLPSGPRLCRVRTPEPPAGSVTEPFPAQAGTFPALRTL